MQEGIFESTLLIDPSEYVPDEGAKFERTDTRQFDAPNIIEWYRIAHEKRILADSQRLLASYAPLNRGTMNVIGELWELAEVYDSSDGDTEETSQLDHALQCAIAARNAGADESVIAALAVHDLAKRRLQLDGVPDYFNVGDTWPLGCQIDPAVVFAKEFGSLSSDAAITSRLGEEGVYKRSCGLKNVHLSFGHDEYGWLIFGQYFPEPVQYFLRYHSFYGYHSGGGYECLLNDDDRAMREVVRRISQFDNYSKLTEKPDREATMKWLKPIILKFIPKVVAY